ncbi:MAG: YqaJ viral recombinase family protein [Eubacteriales bacterium]|nr:YqaJ viral recombinase family protein [Eubacteriales bacterium]
MGRMPIILGDFNDPKYKKLSPDALQKLFEESRYYGLDGSVKPFAIGGSDVASIYGESPWNTPLDLYWGKLKREKALVYEENEEAKDAGHKSEAIVLNTFCKKSGLKARQNTVQARHPDYPHCVANVDGFVVENGKVGIYEGKTTSCDSFNAIIKWKKKELPIYYELQVRFYMGVWDMDFAYVCCCWGNPFKTNEIGYIRVERDKALEKAIFEDCEEFVTECLKGKVPSLSSVKDAELVAKSLTRIYGHADPYLPPVTLKKSYRANFDRVLECEEEITKIKNEVSEKNKTVKDWEAKRLSYLSPILEELKTATEGVLTDGNDKYILHYKPTGRYSIDTTMLKEEYPDVYEKVYLPSENRKLKLEKTNIS